MKTQPELKVTKLTANATIPSRGSDTAAGYDLYVDHNTVIEAKSQALVSTGIAMAIPDGWFGQINPRSSVASKRNLRIGARVIDSDYRGEVYINIHNDNDSDILIERGERIAQIIFMEHYSQPLTEVDSLDETVRGTGGFGSTGI